jgi:5-formyltetrahydrofolate cyclo-ligase
VFGFRDKSDGAKARLRKEMRLLRRELLDETPEASRRAALKLPVSRFSRFSIIGAYCVTGTELDPGPTLTAILELGQGRIQAALPVAEKKDAPLRFRLWREDQPLIPDAYGIPSPPPSSPEVSPNLLLTPVLAFDRAGGRLGQGGGHYDRTITLLRKQRPVFVLGLAFAGQEVDEVPMGRHDQRLDAIVTETEFIEVAKKAP